MILLGFHAIFKETHMDLADGFQVAHRCCR